MKTCYFCKGATEHRSVDYMAHGKAGYVLVKGLPAEVCVQCGETCLDAASSRRVDDALSRATASPERIEIPVVACR